MFGVTIDFLVFLLSWDALSYIAGIFSMFFVLSSASLFVIWALWILIGVLGILICLLVIAIADTFDENSMEVNHMQSTEYGQYWAFPYIQPQYDAGSNVLKVFARSAQEVRNLFFVTRNLNGEFYLHYIGPKFVSVINSDREQIKEAKQERHNIVKLNEYSRRKKLPCIIIPKARILEEPAIKLQPGIFMNAQFVDIDRYEHNLCFVPFLLEPERAYIIDELKKEISRNASAIIFTESRPWVVLLVVEQRD